MRNTFTNRIISGVTAFLFSVSLLMPPGPVSAQSTILPPTGLIGLSPNYSPAVIKGMTIHPDNPFRFDFIVDPGQDDLNGRQLEEETEKLIRYFLASLTVPENEMWVNLSPGEEDRIIADAFGRTAMGRDLLAQDYLLKQLTASLLNPENEAGREMWDRIYAEADRQYGTTDIEINLLNKVWIIPEESTIFVQGRNVFVSDSKLKVMLEEDYEQLAASTGLNDKQASKVSAESLSIVKDIIIPELQHEVNHGKHFANLRQIFHSMILATWYKQNLKQTILHRNYVNSHKMSGIEIDDSSASRKIYDSYMEIFRSGVNEFIREEYNPATQEVIARKYFTGGVDAAMLGGTMNISDSTNVLFSGNPHMAKVELNPVGQQGRGETFSRGQRTGELPGSSQLYPRSVIPLESVAAVQEGDSAMLGKAARRVILGGLLTAGLWSWATIDQFRYDYRDLSFNSEAMISEELGVQEAEYRIGVINRAFRTAFRDPDISRSDLRLLLQSTTEVLDELDNTLWHSEGKRLEGLGIDTVHQVLDLLEFMNTELAERQIYEDPELGIYLDKVNYRTSSFMSSIVFKNINQAQDLTVDEKLRLYRRLVEVFEMIEVRGDQYFGDQFHNVVDQFARFELAAHNKNPSDNTNMFHADTASTANALKDRVDGIFGEDRREARDGLFAVFGLNGAQYFGETLIDLEIARREGSGAQVRVPESMLSGIGELNSLPSWYLDYIRQSSVHNGVEADMIVFKMMLSSIFFREYSVEQGLRILGTRDVISSTDGYGYRSDLPDFILDFVPPADLQSFGAGVVLDANATMGMMQMRPQWVRISDGFSRFGLDAQNMSDREISWHLLDPEMSIEAAAAFYRYAVDWVTEMRELAINDEQAFAARVEQEQGMFFREASEYDGHYDIFDINVAKNIPDPESLGENKWIILSSFHPHAEWFTGKFGSFVQSPRDERAEGENTEWRQRFEISNDMSPVYMLRMIKAAGLFDPKGVMVDESTSLDRMRTLATFAGEEGLNVARLDGDQAMLGQETNPEVKAALDLLRVYGRDAGQASLAVGAFDILGNYSTNPLVLSQLNELISRSDLSVSVLRRAVEFYGESDNPTAGEGLLALIFHRTFNAEIVDSSIRALFRDGAAQRKFTSAAGAFENYLADRELDKALSGSIASTLRRINDPDALRIYRKYFEPQDVRGDSAADAAMIMPTMPEGARTAISELQQPGNWGIYNLQRKIDAVDALKEYKNNPDVISAVLSIVTIPESLPFAVTEAIIELLKESGLDLAGQALLSIFMTTQQEDILKVSLDGVIEKGESVIAELGFYLTGHYLTNNVSALMAVEALQELGTDQARQILIRTLNLGREVAPMFKYPQEVYDAIQPFTIIDGDAAMLKVEGPVLAEAFVDRLDGYEGKDIDGRTFTLTLNREEGQDPQFWEYFIYFEGSDRQAGHLRLHIEQSTGGELEEYRVANLELYLERDQNTGVFSDIFNELFRQTPVGTKVSIGGIINEATITSMVNDILGLQREDMDDLMVQVQGTRRKISTSDAKEFLNDYTLNIVPLIHFLNQYGQVTRRVEGLPTLDDLARKTPLAKLLTASGFESFVVTFRKEDRPGVMNFEAYKPGDAAMLTATMPDVLNGFSAKDSRGMAFDLKRSSEPSEVAGMIEYDIYHQEHPTAVGHLTVAFGYDQQGRLNSADISVISLTGMGVDFSNRGIGRAILQRISSTLPQGGRMTISRISNNRTVFRILNEILEANYPLLDTFMRRISTGRPYISTDEIREHLAEPIGSEYFMSDIIQYLRQYDVVSRIVPGYPRMRVHAEKSLFGKMLLSAGMKDLTARVEPGSDTLAISGLKSGDAAMVAEQREVFIDFARDMRARMADAERIFVFADMDGTLTESHQPLSPERAADLVNYLELGGVLTVSTGSIEDRLIAQVIDPLRTAVGENTELLNRVYLEADNGAVFLEYDPAIDSFTATSRTELTDVIGDEGVDTVTQVMEEFAREFNLDEYAPGYRRINVTQSAVTLTPLGNIDDPALRKSFDPNRTIRQQWVNELERRLADYLPYIDIRISGTASVNVLPRGVSKGMAVGKVLDKHNGAIRSSLYFGDDFREGGNDNDVLKNGISTAVNVGKPLKARPAVAQFYDYQSSGEKGMFLFLEIINGEMQHRARFNEDAVLSRFSNLFSRRLSEAGRSILVTDMDGTLSMNRNSVISPEVSEVLLEYVENGGLLIVSSGATPQRMIDYFINPLIEHLGDRVLPYFDRMMFQTENGAQTFVYSPSTRSMAAIEQVNIVDTIGTEGYSQLVRIIDEVLTKYNVAQFAPSRDATIVSQSSSSIVISPLTDSKDRTLRAAFQAEDARDNLRNTWAGEIRDKILEAGYSEFIDVRVTGTSSINILPVGIDKAAGIERLAEMFDLPMGGMVYFGNEFHSKDGVIGNDRNMAEAFEGVGLIMNVGEPVNDFDGADIDFLNSEYEGPMGVHMAVMAMNDVLRAKARSGLTAERIKSLMDDSVIETRAGARIRMRFDEGNVEEGSTEYNIDLFDTSRGEEQGYFTIDIREANGRLLSVDVKDIFIPDRSRGIATAVLSRLRDLLPRAVPVRIVLVTNQSTLLSLTDRILDMNIPDINDRMRSALQNDFRFISAESVRGIKDLDTPEAVDAMSSFIYQYTLIQRSDPSLPALDDLMRDTVFVRALGNAGYADIKAGFGQDDSLMITAFNAADSAMLSPRMILSLHGYLVLTGQLLGAYEWGVLDGGKVIFEKGGRKWVDGYRETIEKEAVIAHFGTEPDTRFGEGVSLKDLALELLRDKQSFIQSRKYKRLTRENIERLRGEFRTSKVIQRLADQGYKRIYFPVHTEKVGNLVRNLIGDELLNEVNDTALPGAARYLAKNRRSARTLIPLFGWGEFDDNFTSKMLYVNIEDLLAPSQDAAMLSETQTEFIQDATKLWQRWSWSNPRDYDSVQRRLDLEEELKQDGVEIFTGGESTLNTAISSVWNKVSSSQRPKVKEIIRLMAENVRQHADNSGILLVKFDEDTQKLMMVMMDLGPGFFDSKGIPLIAVRESGRFVQRPDSPYRGVAMGWIYNSADHMRIYTKGHMWAKGSKTINEYEPARQVQGTMIYADLPRTDQGDAAMLDSAEVPSWFRNLMTSNRDYRHKANRLAARNENRRDQAVWNRMYGYARSLEDVLPAEERILVFAETFRQLINLELSFVRESMNKFSESYKNELEQLASSDLSDPEELNTFLIKTTLNGVIGFPAVDLLIDHLRLQSSPEADDNLIEEIAIALERPFAFFTDSDFDVQPISGSALSGRIDDVYNNMARLASQVLNVGNQRLLDALAERKSDARRKLFTDLSRDRDLKADAPRTRGRYPFIDWRDNGNSTILDAALEKYAVVERFPQASRELFSDPLYRTMVPEEHRWTLIHELAAEAGALTPDVFRLVRNLIRTDFYQFLHTQDSADSILDGVFEALTFIFATDWANKDAAIEGIEQMFEERFFRLMSRRNLASTFQMLGLLGRKARTAEDFAEQAKLLAWSTQWIFQDIPANERTEFIEELKRVVRILDSSIYNFARMFERLPVAIDVRNYAGRLDELKNQSAEDIYLDIVTAQPDNAQLVRAELEWQDKLPVYVFSGDGTEIAMQNMQFSVLRNPDGSMSFIPSGERELIIPRGEQLFYGRTPFPGQVRLRNIDGQRLLIENNQTAPLKIEVGGSFWDHKVLMPKREMTIREFRELTGLDIEGFSVISEREIDAFDNTAVLTPEDIVQIEDIEFEAADVNPRVFDIADMAMLKPAQDLFDFLKDRGLNKEQIRYQIAQYLEHYSYKSRHERETVERTSPDIVAYFDANGIEDKTDQSNMLNILEVVLKYDTSDNAMLSWRREIDESWQEVEDMLRATGMAAKDVTRFRTRYGHLQWRVEQLSIAELFEEHSFLTGMEFSAGSNDKIREYRQKIRAGETLQPVMNIYYGSGDERMSGLPDGSHRVVASKLEGRRFVTAFTAQADSAMIALPDTFNATDYVRGLLSTLPRYEGKRDFLGDENINVHWTRQEALSNLVAETVLNAIVEPVGGRVDVSFTRGSDAEIIFEVTNQADIDFQRLREKAVITLGMDRAQVGAMSNEELLFVRGLSRGKTSAAGEVGGKGQGFAGIRDYTENLDGRLEISTGNGQTTLKVVMEEDLLRKPRSLAGDAAMLVNGWIGNIEGLAGMTASNTPIQVNISEMSKIDPFSTDIRLTVSIPGRFEIISHVDLKLKRAFGNEVTTVDLIGIENVWPDSEQQGIMSMVFSRLFENLPPKAVLRKLNVQDIRTLRVLVSSILDATGQDFDNMLSSSDENLSREAVKKEMRVMSYDELLDVIRVYDEFQRKEADHPQLSEMITKTFLGWMLTSAGFREFDVWFEGNELNFSVVRPDRAVLTEDVGGIDLNPANFNLRTEGDQFELDLPDAMPAGAPIEFEGLVPVIFEITPVTNLPLLLGQTDEQSELNLSKL